MIKLDKVSKIYYGKGTAATGISKVSLNFELGEFVAILGESGSGKSTLLNVISGLDSYEDGEMYINGKETSYFDEDERNTYRKKYVANIFQAFNLINNYTVRGNVELALIINGAKKKEIKGRVEEVLKSVGLWKYRNRRVTKLSGGQKQRVAIARALVQNTPIILCDEPTGNLDSKGAREIFELLHNVAQDKLVIVVTHNFEQVERYVTRVIRMSDGKVMEDEVVKKTQSLTYEFNDKKGKMNFFDRIKLAFRNTFSTLTKSLLGILVFFIVALVSSIIFGNFERDAYEERYEGISDSFHEKNPDRVIVKHVDSTPFTEEEINKLSKLDGVYKTNKYDISLDYLYYLYDGEYFFSTYTLVRPLEDLKYTNLTYGRMPEADNEYVLVTNGSIWLFDYPEDRDEFMNNKSYLDSILEDTRTEYQCTGIVIDYELNTDVVMYVKNIDDVVLKHPELFDSGTKWIDINIDGRKVYNSIRLSSSVPEGYVYVNDKFKSLCKRSKCLNKKVTIYNNQYYYDSSIELVIKEVLSSKNISKYIDGYKDLGYYESIIFVNPKDYEKMLSNDIFQISLYSNNPNELIDELLDKNVYKSLVIQNTKEYKSKIYILEKYVFTVLYTVVLVVMFIISYLLLNIILKSRASYYTVIRMLGGTKSDNHSLVYFELILYSIISYVLVIITTILAKNGILDFSALIYLDNSFFLYLFFVMILMGLYTSRKYIKKIFKDSMISTYNMEV